MATRSDSRTAAGILAFLPALCAVTTGIFQWMAVRTQPLDSDAQYFLQLARTINPLSAATTSREPLWSALIALAGVFGGPSKDVVELVGVAGFVLMVTSFQMVARRLFGTLWAGVAALCLAVSPWLIYQSARGLREETSAALVLLLALVLVSAQWSYRKAIGVGILVGLSAILRWDTLLLALPVLVLATVLRKCSPQWLAISVATALVITSPLVVGNWWRYGDPMYFSNIHAVWFRNLEFRDQPGFPTSAELAKDSYAGPHISWSYYLFGLHTPEEMAKRTLWGVAAIPYGTTSLTIFRAVGKPVPPQLAFTSLENFVKVFIPALLVLAGALGGVLLLLSPDWVFGAILFLSVAEFDPRLAITVVPFLLLGMMKTLQMVSSLVRGRSVKTWGSGPHADSLVTHRSETTF